MKSLRSISGMKKALVLVATLLAGTAAIAVGTARLGFAQAIDPIAFCNASGLNVIIGTPNNDTLNGTPAADCQLEFCEQAVSAGDTGPGG